MRRQIYRKPKGSQYLTSRGNHDRADVRRARLRELLHARQLTSADAAVMTVEAEIRAGKASGPHRWRSIANAISNFLNERSISLSFDTAEFLAIALGISLNELVGLTAIEGRREVYLKGGIAMGQWARQFPAPRQEWVRSVAPRDQDHAQNSYLLSLDTSEMDLLWPPGTLLQVVDLADFDAPLRHGNKLIVLRMNPEGYIEISCRQIAPAEDAKTIHLISCSTDSRYKDRILPATWPIEAGRVQEAPNGDKIEVQAVVIGSIQSEL